MHIREREKGSAFPLLNQRQFETSNSHHGFYSIITTLATRITLIPISKGRNAVDAAFFVAKYIVFSLTEFHSESLPSSDLLRALGGGLYGSTDYSHSEILRRFHSGQT